MMETDYSKLTLETFYNCAKRYSATTYQKVNNSIVSKNAINSLNEMLPLTRMLPQAVMYAPSYEFFSCYFYKRRN